MNPTSFDARPAVSSLRALLAGAALLASFLAILLTPTQAFAGTQSFSDPAGDASGGAPDVTDVSVTPSADGTAYSVAVSMSGAAYTSDFFLYLYVDTTGDNVAEYLVRLLGNDNRIELNRWSGSAWTPFTASILEGTSSLTPETIKFGRADIGGAQSFHFWLQAWKYVAGSQPACCFDYAGVFAYAAPSTDGGTSGTGGGAGGGTGGGTPTRTLPPPPPPPPFEAPGGSLPTGSAQGGSGQAGSGQAGSGQGGVSSDKPSTDGTATGGDAKTATAASVKATVPASIRAGRRFAVDVRVTGTSQSAQSGRVACSVTVSGKRLSPGSATLRDGRAACVLRLPAAARGKVARIVVDVTTGDIVKRTILVRRVR
jgi:hypothetical protein